MLWVDLRDRYGITCYFDEERTPKAIMEQQRLDVNLSSKLLEVL